MHFASRYCVGPFLTAILLYSVFFTPTSRPNSTGQGQTIAGLQLFAGKAPTFKVELRNTGQDDLVLNLGTMLASGRKQYPRAIALIITDSEQKSRVFELREPFFVAGRLDPMIVPLPIGGTFSLPVNLDNYWSASSKEYEYKFRGNYWIEAQFTGEKVPRQVDALLAPYWIGAITSNRLSFVVSN